MDGFHQGANCIWRGFQYLCDRPGLWRYGILPMLLNLLITSVVLLVMLVGVSAGLSALHDEYPPGWEWTVLEVLVAIVFIALAVGLALVVWKILEGILCGLFYERLARKIELDLGTPESELKEIPLLHHILDSIRDAGMLIVINGGFLLLHIVPVIGSILATVGTFYYDWWLFGTEYVDYPLDLRGWTSAEKKAFATRYRTQTLGLGAGVMLFGFIPFVGPIALTTAVVGSVLMYHDLTGKRAAPGSSGVSFKPQA